MTALTYPHRVSILWGSFPAPGDAPDTYIFATEDELAAFLAGVRAGQGWETYSEEAEDFIVPDLDEFDTWCDQRETM